MRITTGIRPIGLSCYNAGSEQDLSGWTLTDDADEPAKWRIDELTIGEGEYLLFWASGKDRPYDPATDSGHTNFRLNRDGETLLLFDATGNLVDQLTVAGIPPNVSIGIPPGGGEAVVFGEPTPGSANPPSDATGVITEPVQFSRPSGRYGAFESYKLSGAPTGGTIRYTTDGAIPTDTSTLYAGPLAISDHVAIRARAFAPGRLPSPVVTGSYLIDDLHELDVVSLVTEPGDLFDDNYGIYVLGNNASEEWPFRGANFWRDVEIPVDFSFLPVGADATFSQTVGLKLFGNGSRLNAQRSFALYARSQYGDGDMDYAFFPNRPFR